MDKIIPFYKHRKEDNLSLDLYKINRFYKHSKFDIKCNFHKYMIVFDILQKSSKLSKIFKSDINYYGNPEYLPLFLSILIMKTQKQDCQKYAALRNCLLMILLYIMQRALVNYH